MKDLLNFPLAVYLCAFADDNVYLSYSMWYNIRQSVPCPLNPGDCQVLLTLLTDTISGRQMS